MPIATLQLRTEPLVINGQAVPEGAVWFSKPTLLDLGTYRGDSGRLRVTVIDVDGNPLDVTSAVWGCHVRATVDSPVIVAEMDVIPVAGQTNAVDVVLTPEKSVLLLDENVWDLEMTFQGDVNTLFAGYFYTVGDVTRV